VIYERRNSEEVAPPFAHQNCRNSFRVAMNLLLHSKNPGLQSKPWAEISQRFQRNTVYFLIRSSRAYASGSITDRHASRALRFISDL
jgi:hypothetical protein